MGVFDDDTIFLEAIDRINDRRLEVKDAFTPFPVHGLDKKMGLKESRLGYAAFAFGILGGAIALGLMTFTMTYDWPLNIGGKPDFPLPAFIPITFELTVLIASLGMVTVYFLRNTMLPGFEPKVYHRRSTQDHFVVLVEENNMGDDIKSFMKEIGAIEAKDEEYVEQTGPLPLPIKMK